MTFRILRPIDPQSMMDPHLSEEENIQKIYDLIVGTMQRVLDEEYKKRSLPILG